MFQNISKAIDEEEDQNEVIDKKEKWKQILKNFIKPQNILLYIVVLMASTVSILNGQAPFGIAIFAAACSSGIVALPIFIATFLGTIIGFGIQGALGYILNAFIFLGLMLLIRPKLELEIQNEKRKLGIHLMSAIFLVQAFQIFSANFTVGNVIETLLQCIIAYIFYKIFVNSIAVIQEVGTNKVFSIEEVIGASLLLAISICAIGNVSLLGFSIRNILCVLLVLILGWSNGALIGTTAGVTLGVILSLLNFGEPIIIAVYAVAGLISGTLGKIGRIGVIAGLIAGFAITYFIGEIENIMYIKEALIAGIALIVMPKKIGIGIDDIIGKTKFLPVTRENKLEENKETIYKLNSMSKSIDEIAKSYEEAAATLVEDDEMQENNLVIFKEDLKLNLESIQDNILYEDLIDLENGIVDDIFAVLANKDEVTSDDIIVIFEKHNSYIVGSSDKEMEHRMEKQIYQVVKNINYTYQISKMNFIWKKKVSQNNKIVSEQFNTVSKVINNMAKEMEKSNALGDERKEREIISLLTQKNLEAKNISVIKQKNGKFKIKLEISNRKQEDIIKIEKILTQIFNENVKWKEKEEKLDIYEVQDKYRLNIGISRTTKNKSKVSGDSSSQTKLKDGKYLLAISDGMGSGEGARKSSKIAISMLENLLASGFDKDSSIELINSALSTNIEDDMYATLDISILDLYNGNIEFIKSGACPTYIKSTEGVQVIKENTMPAGMIDKIEVVTYDRDLENGDIIVMCSDGIIESAGSGKENWLKGILEQIQTDNVQKIADIIIGEAIDNGLGIAKDDMTILVAKVELN